MLTKDNFSLTFFFFFFMLTNISKNTENYLHKRFFIKTNRALKLTQTKWSLNTSYFLMILLLVFWVTNEAPDH